MKVAIFSARRDRLHHEKLVAAIRASTDARLPDGLVDQPVYVATKSQWKLEYLSRDQSFDPATVLSTEICNGAAKISHVA